MGKLLNGTVTHIGSIPTKITSSIISLLASLIYIFDPAFQRLGTAIGLTRFTSARFTPEIVKLINRIFISSCIFFLIIFMGYSHYKSVIIDTEIPILGAQEQDVALIFPPVGNIFYPMVPSYNLAPKYRPRTPLFIPYTRNNVLMKQAIISYIAAGWPRADIVIVDNSGTMDANNKKLLSSANPFYLDYDLYRKRYGVTIIQTPTLLSFAQLQNFMLRVAIARDWPYFFWSHMDVAVLSAEELSPYKSFYHRVLDVLNSSGLDQWLIQSPSNTSEYVFHISPSEKSRNIFKGLFDRSESKHEDANAQAKTKRNVHADKPKWAIKMFAYDYLTMINVDAWRDIGQWDPFIPYYNTDCDAYQRLKFAGYVADVAEVGHVFDVAEIIENPEERFFPAPPRSFGNGWGVGPGDEEPASGRINSWRYQRLNAELHEMASRKSLADGGRNSWQAKYGLDERGSPNKDGKPKRKKMEPWTYDPKAFQAAWWGTADAGRAMYIKKWGTMDCDLDLAGKNLDDMWLQEYLETDSEAMKVRKKGTDHYMDILNNEPIR